METKSRWGVILGGYQYGLDCWTKSFPMSFDPQVERSGDQIILWTTDLNLAKNSKEAWDNAKPLVGRLNGLMHILHSAEPLNLTAIAEPNETGGITRHHILEAEVGRFRITGGIIGSLVGKTCSDGLTGPSRTQEQLLADAAGSSNELTDALVCCSKTDNWFELYKAWECIKDHLAPNTVTSLGMTTKTELDRFTRTVNSLYRHRKGRYIPPSNEMKIGEARDFVFGLLRSCLERTASEGKQA